ncbi:MAG: DUF992 domain-containing protein [Pseudomonadota bacterium]
MKHIIRAAVATLAACGLMGLGGASVSAQSAALEVGTLTCNVSGGGSFVVGSTKRLNCTFTGLGGQNDRYLGEISKIGLDLGVTAGGVIVWTVLSATSDLVPGALSGSYSGVGAEAAVGIGGGAKLLVGGSDSSISLQPLSLQGGSGLNVSVAVETMTLLVDG